MAENNKYSYVMTKPALNDIDETLKYISDTLGNAPAALSLIDKIENAMDKICLFPMAYPDCSDFLITNPLIRHFLIDNYALIYRVESSNNRITVLRFCYMKMDLTKIKL